MRKRLSTLNFYSGTSSLCRIFEKEKNASATDKMVVVHLDVDVCESMGANTVNTVAEGISSRLVGKIVTH